MFFMAIYFTDIIFNFVNTFLSPEVNLHTISLMPASLQRSCKLSFIFWFEMTGKALSSSKGMFLYLSRMLLLSPFSSIR